MKKLIAALLVAASAVPASATVLLDQESASAANAGFGTSNGGFRRAQTFTVGIGGTLTGLQVRMSGTATAINLLSTVGGTPSSIIANGTVGALVNGYRAFTFSVPVAVADVLAFEIIGGSISGTAPGAYAGGGDFFMNPAGGVPSFSATGYDAIFRSYVDDGVAAAVPEPAMLGLFGLGAIGLVARRRRSV